MDECAHQHRLQKSPAVRTDNYLVFVNVNECVQCAHMAFTLYLTRPVYAIHLITLSALQLVDDVQRALCLMFNTRSHTQRVTVRAYVITFQTVNSVALCLSLPLFTSTNPRSPFCTRRSNVFFADGFNVFIGDT